MLPSEAIEEFKQLYAEHFGEELSVEEARRKAEKFLDLYRAAYSRKPAAYESTRD